MSDRWAEWLRLRQTGGSEEERRALLDYLTPIRNQVINPLAPTLREAIEVALSRDEATQLADVLRPQVEHGEGSTRSARAFMTAARPAG